MRALPRGNRKPEMGIRTYRDRHDGKTISLKSARSRSGF